MKILYVCTGNICRSPMAEGITNAIAKEENKDVLALSAGLYPLVGEPVSGEAVEAVGNKIDISSHRARAVTPDLLEAADWVLAMTLAHKEELVYRYPEWKDKIKTLAEMAGEKVDVADPYRQPQSVYDETVTQLEKYIVMALNRAMSQEL